MASIGNMGARLGMLIVETIAKVRRAYFVQKKSIKAICREFRLSRKVVRKVIRSEATEFRYERGRQPRPRIGPWRDQLDGLLLANEEKPARERLTLIRVFEELRRLGYEGGYDAVRRYARVWRAARGAATAQAYVPLSFAPGEAYQFDWSHEIVLMNRMPVTVKVAHVRLCHSRMPFVRAYPRESQEMVFDAHARGQKLFMLAQASISVPSTEKWSSDNSALTEPWLSTAAMNFLAMSPSIRRSRFLVNTVAPHTSASSDSPTNQRNSRL
jgi:hypothetical protein